LALGEGRGGGRQGGTTKPPLELLRSLGGGRGRGDRETVAVILIGDSVLQKEVRKEYFLKKFKN
jgi:hypothetical protein